MFEDAIIAVLHRIEGVFFLITWLRVPEMFGHQLCFDTYTWTQAIIAVEMLHPVMSFCDGADCDHAAFSDVWSASITLLFAWEDVGIVHTEARHGMGCSMVVFFCVDYYLGSIFNSRWATSVPSQVQNFECWYIPGVSSLVPSLCFLISFGKHCTESTSAIFECFWGEGSTLDCCNFPWDLSEHLGIPWWCQLAKRNSQLSGWVQVMCSVTTHFKRLDMVSGDHDSAWPGSCYWCWCPRMTCLQNIDVSLPLVFFKVLIRSLWLQQALLSELWTWFWCSSWSAPCSPTRILVSKSTFTDVVFQLMISQDRFSLDDRCQMFYKV